MFIEITDPENSNPILINVNTIVSVLLAEDILGLNDENAVAIGLSNGSIAYAKEQYFEIKNMIKEALKGDF